ncbi:uncharacterized protein LOC109822040 isoform X1 [Asparagus officinalis]|uniref:uncharacterized protein LOC109822040 isoform X1 n=1 Tax=Asparagus officinalis TaxID=4686 RepID=UPI00098E7D0A|nr:uncharacterized protein LOC109822040 isoform X1 [Asparagus officinalis]
MSVLLCGKRSPASFFEDEYHTPVPASKRIRCSAALQFSPPPASVTSPPSTVVSPVDRLRALFPDMDEELLAKALEVSGNDLDIAIKNLNNLHLESARAELDFAENNKSNVRTEANIWSSPEAHAAAGWFVAGLLLCAAFAAAGGGWCVLVLSFLQLMLLLFLAGLCLF